MLPYRDSRLTQIALGIFFIILLGYAYFEARGLLFGPTIAVTSDIQEVYDPFITITGHTDHISSISMNGKPIQVTEEGDFSEPYLHAPGYNRIVLEARDKYGRHRSQTLEIVYSKSAAEQTSTTTSVGTTSTNDSSSLPVAPMQ